MHPLPVAGNFYHHVGIGRAAIDEVFVGDRLHRFAADDGTVEVYRLLVILIVGELAVQVEVDGIFQQVRGLGIPQHEDIQGIVPC